MIMRDTDLSIVFQHHDGLDVYHWPEFIAFAKRLGIARELPTVDLTITIPINGVVRIAHDYYGATRHLPAEDSDGPRSKNP